MNEDLGFPITPEQKESIKLMKMSKGFQWEIKIHIAFDDENTLKRLDFLNKSLEEKYSNQLNEQEVKKT